MSGSLRARTLQVPPEPDLVFSAAQLEEVWLGAVAFRENPSFDMSIHGGIEYFVNESTEIEFTLTEEGEVPQALLRLGAEIEWRGYPAEDGDELKPPDEIPFDLSLTIVGRFSLSKLDRDEEFLRAWLEYNGVYLLWPYLRQHVAQITGAGSLPTLTIYTMRVPRPPAGPDDKDVDQATESTSPETNQATS
jgi:hypothetical protein